MKKTILIIMVFLFAVLVSACGQSSSQTEGVSENGTSAQGVVPDGTLDLGGFQFEMPLQTLLILGTFKLEETDLAIQAEQAKELLPLWQVLKSLLDSDTAAREEIDALVNQIAETMTDKQMQAIQAMGLTMQDLFTLNTDLGLNLAFPQAGDIPQGEETGGFQRPEGMPEGMPQGMGPRGGQGLSPDELESLRATREAAGGRTGLGMRGGMINIPLIDALIELLQSK